MCMLAVRKLILIIWFNACDECVCICVCVTGLQPSGWFPSVLKSVPTHFVQYFDFVAFLNSKFSLLSFRNVYKPKQTLRSAIFPKIRTFCLRRASHDVVTTSFLLTSRLAWHHNALVTHFDVTLADFSIKEPVPPCVGDLSPRPQRVNICWNVYT